MKPGVAHPDQGSTAPGQTFADPSEVMVPAPSSGGPWSHPPEMSLVEPPSGTINCQGTQLCSRGARCGVSSLPGSLPRPALAPGRWSGG
jgi:hypothetical protein